MSFYIYGGNEQSTHKYVAELLGKVTIDTNTYGKSTGHSGSYSTNYQATGRELLTADEVRMLDNQKAILLIRGEKPVIDYKFDIMKHPNVKFTADGEGEFYEHGATDKATASIALLDITELKESNITKEMKEFQEISYELLSEEDIENYILMEEYENERKQKNNN